MKLYLEVTQDELSLPLAVATSMTELGRITGISPNTIRGNLFKARHGMLKNEYPRFIVIEVEEENERRRI